MREQREVSGRPLRAFVPSQACVCIHRSNIVSVLLRILNCPLKVTFVVRTAVYFRLVSSDLGHLESNPCCYVWKTLNFRLAFKALKDFQTSRRGVESCNAGSPGIYLLCVLAAGFCLWATLLVVRETLISLANVCFNFWCPKLPSFEVKSYVDGKEIRVLICPAELRNDFMQEILLSPRKTPFGQRFRLPRLACGLVHFSSCCYCFSSNPDRFVFFFFLITKRWPGMCQARVWLCRRDVWGRNRILSINSAPLRCPFFPFSIFRSLPSVFAAKSWNELCCSYLDVLI